MTATIALPRPQPQPHSDFLSRLRTIGLGLGGRGVMGLGLGARAPYLGAGYLLYDSFTDADGVLLQNHTPEAGAWILNSGDLHVIYNNKDTPAAWGKAHMDAGVSQPVVAQVTATITGGQTGEARGLVVWGANSNTNIQYYCVGRTYDNFSIRDGTFGTILAFTPIGGGTWTNVVIRAECVGGSITATLNGANTIQANGLTPWGTCFGVRNRYVGDTFDDFSVAAL